MVPRLVSLAFNASAGDCCALSATREVPCSCVFRPSCLWRGAIYSPLLTFANTLPRNIHYYTCCQCLLAHSYQSSRSQKVRLGVFVTSQRKSRRTQFTVIDERMSLLCHPSLFFMPSHRRHSLLCSERARVIFAARHLHATGSNL